ncbi:autotransporter outer membrane beta-barrel domain-containing protein, partial [Ralstonia pseudosolanacearum]|uniref:autotransporter outer membrane beta-barrel domain-containing protein n=1 Tax=Ralstonia pseudosolanacearum TaxID=1310165 RepID=UPI003D2B8BE6
GKLVLTGANSWRGDTQVLEGQLAVNGSVVGKVIVKGAGTLSGNGQIGSLSAERGGTVAPGNSIGTLHVTGDVTFAPGSIYAVEIAPDGSRSDSIISGGKVSLQGGTLLLTLENQSQPISSTAIHSLLGKRLTILQAAQGIDGRFDAVTPTFLSATLSYESSALGVTMDRNATPFAIAARSDNEQGIATALETAPRDSAVYGAMLLSPSTDAAYFLLRQFNSDIYPAAQGMLIQDARLVRDAALDRFRGDAGTAPVAVWAQALGAWGKSRTGGG